MEGVLGAGVDAANDGVRLVETVAVDDGAELSDIAPVVEGDPGWEAVDVVEAAALSVSDAVREPELVGEFSKAVVDSEDVRLDAGDAMGTSDREGDGVEHTASDVGLHGVPAAEQAVQGVHTTEPFVPVNLPLGQAVHVTAPARLLKAPAAQATHTSEDDAAATLP